MSTMRREWGWFKRFAGNGGKWLLIANIYFIVAITITLIVLVSTECSKSTFEPLEYQNPATIQTPGVKVGESVHATITRCNHSDQEIPVEGSYSARNLDTGAIVPQRIGSPTVWVPGCVTISPDVPLVGLTPGNWRLEGFVIARSTHNETQIEPWFSLPFRVEGDE